MSKQLWIWSAPVPHHAAPSSRLEPSAPPSFTAQWGQLTLLKKGMVSEGMDQSHRSHSAQNHKNAMKEDSRDFVEAWFMCGCYPQPWQHDPSLRRLEILHGGPNNGAFVPRQNVPNEEKTSDAPPEATLRSQFSHLSARRTAERCHPRTLLAGWFAKSSARHLHQASTVSTHLKHAILTSSILYLSSIKLILPGIL